MPVLRKGHAPLAPAQQQRHPQARLQRAQMCAGSGLGQVQQLRSPGQLSCSAAAANTSNCRKVYSTMVLSPSFLRFII